MRERTPDHIYTTQLTPVLFGPADGCSLLRTKGSNHKITRRPRASLPNSLDAPIPIQTGPVDPHLYAALRKA